jgi:1-acyl-sn-glycerol-3-phosphate acyltransferase
MKHLRAFVYVFTLFVIVIPYSIMVIFTIPLPRMLRYRIIRGWPRFATWLAIHVLGIRYEVRGKENIPAEPLIILSKHQSAWETLAFNSIFPPHLFVIKRELLWLPFLGWGLKIMDVIAINRTNRKEAMEQVTTQGAERLAHGFSILMFPEGTRTAAGKRGNYRRGGAALAINTGAKILPVAHNAGLLWPRNSFVKYPGTVTVVVGKPIETKGREPAELMREVEEWIEGQMRELIPGMVATRVAPVDNAVQEIA